MIKTKEVNAVDEINGYLNKGWTLISVKEKDGKIELLLDKEDEKTE